MVGLGFTRRFDNPVIYERSDRLGGTFIPASAESCKGKLRELLDWYRRQMEELEIDVRLGTEIKSILQLGKGPVIIATGAVPRVLSSVKGHEKMIEACDYLRGQEVGDKVAVIGGGLTGCEIAYELYLQGKQPLIVEMLPDLICQKGVCLANSSYLREFFAWKKVPVYLETALKEVTEDGIIVRDKDGRETEIPCDSVISSAGYLPAPLADQGRKEVYLVGDCRKVGNLRSVIWGAYETAMKI